MKLKEIADMNDYLENRCYCLYEIYDMTGFFYELFYPETECTVLVSGSRGAIHGIFVITSSDPIGNINGKEQIEKFMNGEIDKMSFDEFDDTNTSKELEKVLSVADAICIS